jgi:predicted lipoprotein with Yx(FWY)xxD motif
VEKHHTSVVMMLAGLAACGSANATNARSNNAGPATNPMAYPSAGARVVVNVASSPFGRILVDERGKTLYAFTDDTDAKPSCSGCGQAWCAATVNAAWSVANGLDSGLFRAVNSGGHMQLIAGNFPLYRFSGDAGSGDVNGQGIDGAWFLVDTRARPIPRRRRPPTTTVAPANETSNRRVERGA